MNFFNKTKYFTEISYQSHVLRPFLIRPSDLYRLKENSDQEMVRDLEKCNIYFICKRPKIITNSNSVSYNEREVIFNFEITKNGKLIPFTFTYPRNPGQFPEWATHFEISSYPHDSLLLYSANREVFYEIPFSQFIQGGIPRFAGEYSDYLLNLEVLYIGQSYSKKKKRNIIDRLKSHSTLQRISLELGKSSPDYEVVIFLFDFSPYKLIMMFNGKSGGMIEGNEDTEHRKRILEYSMSEPKAVALNEAALIRYFEPKYNVIYAKEFPSTNHEILKDCYKLDFYSLVVEVQAEFFEVQFYTVKVPPKSHHVAQIDLHDPKERASMFLMKM